MKLNEKALGAAIIEGSNMAGERLVTQIVTAYLEALGDEGWVIVPKAALFKVLENVADDEGPFDEGWRSVALRDAMEQLERAMLSAAGGRDE